MYLSNAGASVCGATTDISLPQSGLNRSTPLVILRICEGGEAIGGSLATNVREKVAARTMGTLGARG
jgi:hypothetical protein